MHLVGLLILCLLAINSMYFSEIKRDAVKTIDDVGLIHANCDASSKYSSPTISVYGVDKNIHVLKSFVWKTQCHLQEGYESLSHSKFTISYVMNNNELHAVSVLRDGEVIYAEGEFEGKRSSVGALIFLACIAGLCHWWFKYKVV